MVGYPIRILQIIGIDSWCEPGRSYSLLAANVIYASSIVKGESPLPSTLSSNMDAH